MSAIHYESRNDIEDKNHTHTERIIPSRVETSRVVSIACGEWSLEAQKRIRNIWIRVSMQAIVQTARRRRTVMNWSQMVAIIIHEANEGSCWLLKRIKCDIFIASGRHRCLRHWIEKSGLSFVDVDRIRSAAVCCCFLSRSRAFIYASIRNRKSALLEQHGVT